MLYSRSLPKLLKHWTSGPPEEYFYTAHIPESQVGMDICSLEKKKKDTVVIFMHLSVILLRTAVLNLFCIPVTYIVCEMFCLEALKDFAF